MFCAAAVLTACSSAKPPAKAPVLPDPNASTSAVSLSKHPYSKFLEFAGFRIAQSGAGKIKISYAVINHSQADLGSLTIKFRLVTTSAKPEDPPVAEFQSDIASLGPNEVKEGSGEAATKLRAFELPDWQFLRAQYEILKPTP